MKWRWVYAQKAHRENPDVGSARPCVSEIRVLLQAPNKWKTSQYLLNVLWYIIWWTQEWGLPFIHQVYGPCDFSNSAQPDNEHPPEDSHRRQVPLCTSGFPFLGDTGHHPTALFCTDYPRQMLLVGWDEFDGAWWWSCSWQHWCSGNWGKFRKANGIRTRYRSEMQPLFILKKSLRRDFPLRWLPTSHPIVIDHFKGLSANFLPSWVWGFKCGHPDFRENVWW